MTHLSTLSTGGLAVTSSSFPLPKNWKLDSHHTLPLIHRFSASSVSLKLLLNYLALDSFPDILSFTKCFPALAFESKPSAHN